MAPLGRVSLVMVVLCSPASVKTQKMVEPKLTPKVIFGTPRHGTLDSAQRRKCNTAGFQDDCPRVREARVRRLPGIRKTFAARGIEYPPAEVLIRAFKHEDELEQWARPRGQREFVHLKTYAICCKSGKLGPKRRLGDLQVPEGFYHVTGFNPWSSYLLSMAINYPNRSDIIRGHPKKPGGNICIHGSCVTIGCITVNDPDIEELYVIALDTVRSRRTKVLVHVFPGRMDDKGIRWLRKEFGDRSKLIEFWEELKVGFDGLEDDRIPDRFSILQDGAYSFYASSIRWRSLDPGLEIAVIHAPRKSSHADSRFTVVRVDPAVRKLALMTASEVGGSKRTAPQWSRDFDLSLVVNAGMFEDDQSRATYFMKNLTHVNNPLIAGQNAFLAFNPIDGTVPPVQIIDRRCQSFPRLKKMYNTVIQGIRMVDCRQKRTWSTQNRKWSMVVAAMDMKGRVLFIFTRSPYRVQVFVDMLLGLPLDIRNMMYLEGGPEASLYLSAGATVVEKFGSYETGFNENDDNQEFWPLPNIIGVVKIGSMIINSHGMEK